MLTTKQKLTYVFSNLFHDEFKFIGECNEWFYLEHTSKIWKKDENKLILLNVIKSDFPIRLYTEFENQLQQIEELFILDILDLRGKIEKTLLWLKSERNIKSLSNELKTKYFVESLKIFNTNPEYLLFNNEMMFNLSTKQMEPIHSYKLISNIQQMNVEYKAIDEDKQLIIENIFDLIVENENKSLLIQVLFQALLGINSRKVIIYHGSSNKTCFLKSFMQICGTYGITLDNKIWNNNRTFTRCLLKTKLKRIVLLKNVPIKKVKPYIIKDFASTSQFTARSIYGSQQQMSFTHQTFFIDADQPYSSVYEMDFTLKSRIIEIEFKEPTIKDISIIQQSMNEYGIQFIHYILNNYK